MLTDKNIKEIASHYGLKHQLKKLIEELVELLEALASKNSSHITEECADVLVLIDQIKYLIICDSDLEQDEIQSVYIQKVKRQIERMKEENK